MARDSTSSRVVAVLKRGDSLTVGELSERLGLTTSQARSAVSRLVKARQIVSDGGKPAEYRVKA
jgi:predicted ArsR family transcriptional regulator